ncbi:YmaF family protein [Ammoniphilus sp. YIM 78166]|uniref:YmaF family protein n=1 Tax=Ammoniphilus sp. YIM 78166 TaxID=1644106 RepID=UPI0014311AEC|nr:YmaF family protein [Ammoniphilus sp. YIM 78166]
MEKYVITHSHYFKGVTSIEGKGGHFHTFHYTTNPESDEPNHVHHYVGYTSTDERHNHEFTGKTGPAIYLQDGSHYHIVSGYTTVRSYSTHRHYFEGVTNVIHPRKKIMMKI